jgi:hypothetical protein
MKFLQSPSCVVVVSFLFLVQLGFAQQVSLRITPLRPMEELRAEALKEQPHEPGASSNLIWWSGSKSTPSSSSTSATPPRTIFWVQPYTPRPAPSFNGRRRKHCFASTANSRLTDAVPRPLPY